MSAIAEAKAERKSGLDAPVLVLDRNFQPARLASAKTAFVLIFGGKAKALSSDFEAFDWNDWMERGARDATLGYECIGTVRGPIPIPKLVQLSTLPKRRETPLRLSRKNIYLRDAHTCQYCGNRPPIRDLNLDHVLPRSRAGKSSWENLVTSCRSCNMRKGGLTPEEAQMQLRNHPRKPSWDLALRIASAGQHFPEWQPFLMDSSRSA